MFDTRLKPLFRYLAGNKSNFNSIKSWWFVIGTVNGKLCDEVFGLDGKEESIMYAHLVGTISKEDIEKEKDFYRFVKEEGL